MLHELEIGVFKDGQPYRIVTCHATDLDHAIRRATGAVFMDDLRNDNDPKLRDHYSGFLYDPQGILDEV